MPTTVSFANGTTRAVSNVTGPLVRGLDADGDLVIEPGMPGDADGPYLIALTPCCDATGKGAEGPTGVVCRQCFTDVHQKFGGRAEVAVPVTATETATVEVVPLPEWEDDVLTVGEVVRIADDGRSRKLPVLYRVIACTGPAGSERYELEPCRGGRGVIAYRSGLVRETDPAALARAGREEEQAAALGVLVFGSIVKFAKPKKDDERGLFVVTAVNTKATYNVAPLGGSPDGRYYRGVTSAHLVPVPRSAVVVVEDEL